METAPSATRAALRRSAAVSSRAAASRTAILATSASRAALSRSSCRITLRSLELPGVSGAAAASAPRCDWGAAGEPGADPGDDRGWRGWRVVADGEALAGAVDFWRSCCRSLSFSERSAVASEA